MYFDDVRVNRASMLYWVQFMALVAQWLERHVYTV